MQEAECLQSIQNRTIWERHKKGEKYNPNDCD